MVMNILTEGKLSSTCTRFSTRKAPQRWCTARSWFGRSSPYK